MTLSGGTLLADAPPCKHFRGSKFLPIAGFRRVWESPTDRGQAIGTHMEVGVGCSIGTLALTVGLADFCDGPGWYIV